jgi:type IV pilus assembly protein PilX
MMRTNRTLPNNARSPIGRQRGAALVVGLILMLALTVLGISGMNSSTLELTMAGNTQSANDAFQAAETGIDIAIDQGNWATSAATPIPHWTDPNGSGAAADATTTNTACTIIPDRSFSSGVMTGSVMAWHFQVKATGTGPRGAKSTHDQDFYIAGPAC